MLRGAVSDSSRDGVWRVGGFGTHCGEVAKGENAEETGLPAGSIADDHQLSGRSSAHHSKNVSRPTRAIRVGRSSPVLTQASNCQTTGQTPGREGAHLRMTLAGVALAIVTTRNHRRRSAQSLMYGTLSSSFFYPRVRFGGGKSGGTIFVEK